MLPGFGEEDVARAHPRALLNGWTIGVTGVLYELRCGATQDVHRGWRWGIYEGSWSPHGWKGIRANAVIASGYADTEEAAFEALRDEFCVLSRTRPLRRHKYARVK